MKLLFDVVNVHELILNSNGILYRETQKNDPVYFCAVRDILKQHYCLHRIDFAKLLYTRMMS